MYFKILSNSHIDAGIHTILLKVRFHLLSAKLNTNKINTQTATQHKRQQVTTSRHSLTVQQPCLTWCSVCICRVPCYTICYFLANNIVQCKDTTKRTNHRTTSSANINVKYKYTAKYLLYFSAYYAWQNEGYWKKITVIHGLFLYTVVFFPYLPCAYSSPTNRRELEMPETQGRQL